MANWLRTEHDAEAFYQTLRRYAEIVRDHITEHGEPPGDKIRSMMPDADSRHLEMVDLLVQWSEIDREEVVSFLRRALALAA